MAWHGYQSGYAQYHDQIIKVKTLFLVCTKDCCPRGLEKKRFNRVTSTFSVRLQCTFCEQKGDWSPALHVILFMWCIGYANDYRAHLREPPLPLSPPSSTVLAI